MYPLACRPGFITEDHVADVGREIAKAVGNCLRCCHGGGESALVWAVSPAPRDECQLLKFMGIGPILGGEVTWGCRGNGDENGRANGRRQQQVLPSVSDSAPVPPEGVSTEWPALQSAALSLIPVALKPFVNWVMGMVDSSDSPCSLPPSPYLGMDVVSGHSAPRSHCCYIVVIPATLMSNGSSCAWLPAAMCPVEAGFRVGIQQIVSRSAHLISGLAHLMTHGGAAAALGWIRTALRSAMRTVAIAYQMEDWCLLERALLWTIVSARRCFLSLHGPVGVRDMLCEERSSGAGCAGASTTTDVLLEVALRKRIATTADQQFHVVATSIVSRLKEVTQFESTRIIINSQYQTLVSWAGATQTQGGRM